MASLQTSLALTWDLASEQDAHQQHLHSEHRGLGRRMKRDCHGRNGTLVEVDHRTWSPEPGYHPFQHTLFYSRAPAQVCSQRESGASFQE